MLARINRVRIKKFLMVLVLSCWLSFTITADDQQCVPCNLPQPMCQVCEGEKLYLVTFRNATNIASSNFRVSIKFSDDPDPEDSINAAPGLPMALLVCAPEEVAIQLQITNTQSSMQPVIATLQGCDVFTFLYDEGSDDVIVKQNSLALAPQPPSSKKPEQSGSCRGLTPDCCSLVACGNGTISEGIVICDMQCVNNNCPTILACAQGIVDNSEIICFADYETTQNLSARNLSTQKAKVAGAQTSGANNKQPEAQDLGQISTPKAIDLKLPELNNQERYAFTPSSGEHAGKKVMLVIEHAQITINQKQAQLIKLYQEIDGQTEFIASFPYVKNAKNLNGLLHNAAFKLNPDGSLSVEYKQQKARTIDIVKALTENKKTVKKPFTKKLFKSLPKVQQDNLLKEVTLPPTILSRIDQISSKDPGQTVGIVAKKK